VSFAKDALAWAAIPLAAKAKPKCSPFAMQDVRLTEGAFKAQAEANQQYLDSLATDRLLHSFRLTAGIISTATPYGGWEVPNGELRGHFAGGHYLSAVAFAYSGGGNDVLKVRGDAMVASLAACQKANGNGYLSAYPTEEFERLARNVQVWAPFYTQHKILAGLIDMYVHTGNQDALQIAEGLAGWTSNYFSGIGDDQRQRMLRTEYGGMNEALVNLAVLTGKERYLATARIFEQPMILDPLAQRRDELQGLHANTTVPKIIGAARMYEVTGDPRYREIAEYFLDDVLRTRCYVIGNTSNDEHWRYPAGDMKGTLSLTNAECCVAYNLMKLERLVFGWTADAHWMDEYERTLFNARLGTQNAQGLKQYFFPLAAGYWRAYNSSDESFWCCTGTGAEDFAKFNDTIYFHSAEDVYVNQFIASELTWKEKAFGLKQTTNFPMEQGTQITVQADRPQERTIFVRIPRWTDERGTVKVNGRELEAFGQPGSYLAIRRTWRTGDKIEVSLPMSLREERLPGDANTVAVCYGPMVLAAVLGDGPKDGPTKIIHGRGTAPKVDEKPGPLPSLSEITLRSAKDLQFAAANGATVMPMFRVEDQRYSVYWQKA
jgi:DUF1680 family protein